jgi:signal recognition particle receptor subunit beta
MAHATAARQPKSRRREPLKIVVSGPFAAGKTTLIETISDVTVLGTEKRVTDSSSAIKDRTTVGLDYGRIALGDNLALALFGTPGQRRFDMMWEILSQGMLGFIVLVNAQDPRSAIEAIHILDAFHGYADVPYLIGVTHLDGTEEQAEAALSRVRRAMDLPSEIPVLACDPRNRADVKKLLLEILQGVMARLDAAS